MTRRKLPDNLNRGNLLGELKQIKTVPLEDDTEKQADKEEKTPFSLRENAAGDKSAPEVPPPPPSIAEKISGAVRLNAPPVKSAKVKVNVYLSPATKRRTERVQMDLRDIVPTELAGQINYSVIVDTALQIVFDEFEKTRNASALSREIINQLNNKT